MITSVFIQVLMFTSDGTVKQNMQTISLPYHSGESGNKRNSEWNLLLSSFIYVFVFLFIQGDINVFRASSFHILLQTSFGLQIHVQHVPVMQVYVSLQPNYRAKTRGKFYICLNMKHCHHWNIYARIQCIYNKLLAAEGIRYYSLVTMTIVMLTYCIMKQYWPYRAVTNETCLGKKDFIFHEISCL